MRQQSCVQLFSNSFRATLCLVKLARGFRSFRAAFNKGVIFTPPGVSYPVDKRKKRNQYSQ